MSALASSELWGRVVPVLKGISLRKYHKHMQRALLIALLVMVSGGAALAQRGLTGFPAAGFGGHPGCCPVGHVPHPSGLPARGQFVLPLFPFWFGYETNTSSTNTPASSAPVETHPRPLEPWPVRPKAQVIEVPESRDAATIKPQALIVFVLMDGTRIAAERYLITTDALRIVLGSQELSFPTSTIDLNATVTLNREHGIALQFPADPGEVVLGF